VRQVNAGTEQINQITQQNASNAEQSAATAAELTNQAAALRTMMGHFQLAGRPPAAAHDGPATAPISGPGPRARRTPARPLAAVHPVRRMAGAAAGASDAAARLIPFDDDDADDVLGSF
jgi:hypothetical protein